MCAPELARKEQELLLMPRCRMSVSVSTSPFMLQQFVSSIEASVALAEDRKRLAVNRGAAAGAEEEARGGSRLDDDDAALAGD